MNKNNTTKSNQKDQRLIDAKISLLQLAEELGNIHFLYAGLCQGP